MLCSPVLSPLGASISYVFSVACLRNKEEIAVTTLFVRAAERELSSWSTNTTNAPPLPLSLCLFINDSASAPIHGQIAVASSSPDLRSKTFTMFFPVITLHSNERVSARARANEPTLGPPLFQVEIREPNQRISAQIPSPSAHCNGPLAACSPCSLSSRA